MSKIPSTRALRALRAAGIAFDIHPYRYEPRGGTRVSARELGVAEHSVIKTLVFETERAAPLMVLMHGDREVSAKALARCLGVKSVRPCDPRVAERHSGCVVGGTSPFGLQKPLPIFAEVTIRQLDRLYINLGARGWLTSLAPAELDRLLVPTWVEVAQA